MCVLTYVLPPVAFVLCSYEQCFDQWYKDVFLQQKADGQAGCREEYTAYWNCFMVRHLYIHAALWAFGSV